MRLERRRQPLVGEQGRVDPTSEVPQVIQRVRGGTLEPVEQCSGLGGIALDHRPRQLELNGERDELLLRAIVQVPFDLPALVVLRRNEATSRRPELLDQEHVPKHEAGLRGEVVHQVLAGAAQWLGGRHRDRERTQALTSMLHVDEGASRWVSVGGPDRGGMELAPR